MTKRAVESRSSKTAAYTCVSRACGARIEDARFRGPDDLSEVFLPWFARWIIRNRLGRRLWMRVLSPPGIFAYVLARTMVFDRAFTDALGGGFDQIVILGAGFDTRALRFSGRNRGTRIFEADIRTTQSDKIRVLEEKGVALPNELVFVPCDFNKESLGNALSGAGYESGRKSAFLWEGVTMYLDSDAVDETLAFIRNTSEPGSTVTFDIVHTSVLRGENRYYGEKSILKRVSASGEGWTFGVEDGGIDAFLDERSFGLKAYHDASSLERDFLTGDDGSLFGRINGTHAIVEAVVV